MEPLFLGWTNSGESLNNLVPHSVFQFKTLMETKVCHSLDFNAFCTIREYVSQTFKSLNKNKWGTKVLGKINFGKVWIICSPFGISILNVLKTQIFCHSLDFNALCMIQEYFSHSLEIFANQRVGDLTFWETHSAEGLNYLLPPAVFQF